MLSGGATESSEFTIPAIIVGTIVLTAVHFINMLLGILSPFMTASGSDYVEMFTKFYSAHGGGVEYHLSVCPKVPEGVMIGIALIQKGNTKRRIGEMVVGAINGGGILRTDFWLLVSCRATGLAGIGAGVGEQGIGAAVVGVVAEEPGFLGKGLFLMLLP